MFKQLKPFRFAALCAVLVALAIVSLAGTQRSQNPSLSGVQELFEFDGPTNLSRARPRIGSIEDVIILDPMRRIFGPTSELIANGSFETSFTGWTTVNGTSSLQNWTTAFSGFDTGFGLDPASPQDGSRVALQGISANANSRSSLYQDFTVPSGTLARLTWKDKYQMDLATFCSGSCGTATYSVQILNTSDVVQQTLYTISTPSNGTTNTGWINHVADLSSFAGQTIRLRFSGITTFTSPGPGQMEIDAVQLQTPILAWNTFGNAGTEITEASVSNDANISPASLSLGAGITAAANANRFGGTGWFDTGNTASGNTLAQAIAGDNYIEFTVTPATDRNFTPTMLSFVWDRSATGPVNVALRSSVDNYATDLATATSVAALGQVNFAISGLNNISTATAFRIYGYGATATTGNGGIDTNSNSINAVLYAAVGAPSPTVTTISPRFGTTAGGTGVTITGTNFVAPVVVTIGGAAATGVSVVNSTTITATTPAGTAGNRSVLVTTPSGNSGSNSLFTYGNPTTESRLSNISIDQGTFPAFNPATLTYSFNVPNSVSSLNLTGTALNPGASVRSNGGTYTVSTNTRNYALASGITSTILVDCRAQDGTTTTTYTVNITRLEPAPTVTGVSPTSGPTAGGTPVTITGTKLTGATAVKFGGTAATGVTVVSDTQITATTPAHAAGVVSVDVTTAGGTNTTNLLYTYIAPPVITVGAASLPAFATTNVGSATVGQNTGVSGTNLTTGVTCAAPSTDFQVSLNNGTTWNPSVTFPQTSGNASGTLSVRFRPQSGGALSGNVTCSSTGAVSKTIAVSGTGVDQTQASDNFRSKDGIGFRVWTAASSWESSHDGVSNWITASLAPTTSAAAITIQSNHVVFVQSAVTADQLTVQTNASLFVDIGGALTINDGSGTDLTIQQNGSLDARGAITNNGQVSVSGLIYAENASSFAGNGFTYASGSQLNYTADNISTTNVEFPAVSGPPVINIIPDNGGTITLHAPRTITTQITLGSGTFAAGANLTLANGCTVFGTDGHLTGTPTFAGVVDVTYYNDGSTGPELPASATALRDLTLGSQFNSADRTLNSSITVNGTLNLSNYKLTTGANTVAISASGSVARGSGFVAGNLKKTFASAGSLRFEVGTANGYSPVDVNAASGGSFTVAANQGPATGTGLPVNRLQRSWTLTNGGLTSANLTFNYLAGDVTAGVEANYKAYRIMGGAATLVNGTTDAGAHTATVAGVTAFGDWTTAEAPAAPTVASISGRVKAVSGRGITNATVTVSGGSLPNPITVTTDRNGSYLFANLNINLTYTVIVNARRFTFSPASHVLTPSADIANSDFIAQQ